MPSLATRAYSPLFGCIHDEPHPVGNLGRGAHYSIFRCAEWFDVVMTRQPVAHLHNFAVIWDQDHDERIIPVIESLYVSGLLSPIQFIGERKGCITIILAAKFYFHGSKADSELYREHVRGRVAKDSADSWSVDFGTFDRSAIEHQCDPKSLIEEPPHVALAYMRTLDSMWSLGTQPALKAGE